MKRKFGNLLMAAALMFAMGSFFTSCRDYDEELQAEMYAQVIDQINDELGTDVADLKETVDAILPTVQADINGLESVIAALEARVAELEALNHDHSNFATKEELAAAKAELEAAQAELDAAIKELADKMATKEALEEVATSLNDLKGEFATHVELFNALSNTVTEALGRLSTLEGEYEALDARVKAIEDAKYQEQIDAIKGDLGKVVKQAAEADARSKANETAIEALEAYNVEFAQAVKDSVAALRAEAAAKLAEAKAYADEAAAAVAAELAKTNATVAELQAAFAEAVAELQDQIDVLAEELDELKEALGLLQDEVDDMRKDMNEQISGIVLNGAYSPVVGYFALPTGVKSNILAAYYGEVDTDFYFPTLRTANNVGAAFDADFEALGFVEEKTEAGVLIAGNGNAGKVYMTINPAEVSLEGKEFALVNSLGEVSPAVLSVPVKSDMKLNFGYTRGEAVALYEAEATIAAEDVEAAKIRIELSELKDALKAIVSVGDGVNVTDLISKLYAIVNDIADANAVKATWTDSKGEAHTVYSDYGLAAVAVKPLSYNFLADLNVTSVPGYHEGMSLVNKIFDKVGTVSLPDLGLSNLAAKLESINFGSAIGENLEFTVKYSQTITKEIPFKTTVNVEIPLKDIVLDIPIDEQVIKTGSYDLNGKEIVVTVPASSVKHIIKAEDIAEGSTTVTIDEIIKVEIPVEFEVPVKIATKDVLGDLGGTLESLDALLAEVNGMLANVSGKVEAVESVLNDALDKVQSGLNTYLGVLNNKVCGLINSFNAVLQPTMLVSTTDGFSMLSSIKGAPTTIDNASAVLVPTSFTAEVLAPACKKFVAVTNAYKDGQEDLAEAKAANTGDLATVLPGSTRAVQFNGKSGYTYEITYSAVDFYGMISNTKYYVKVK